MAGRSRRFLALAALFVTGLVAVVAASAAGAGNPTRIEIRVHYSQFGPTAITVPAGRPVTFVIRNDDPIDHEWIVGDDAVQQRHRTGTEEHHDSRPTEISIPALSTRETTITFAQPVVWRYICHLPGHEAYGMVGTLVTR